MKDIELMLEKQVLKTIEEHNLIKPRQHIVLGLSGGPDSVCLFHVLLKLGKERNWHIHAVHVNHRLRPGAAEEDQAYTEALCRQAGVSCRTFVFDCEAIARAEKMTSEEAGRKVRYQAFAETAAELREQGVSADDICIAVAQNADDQAETILFRLLRGAGLEGLAGIRYERRDTEGNRVVRPLLDVYKKQVLAYCEARALSPRMDHTNDEPLYTRNRLRLSLIPQLEQEYNPAIRDTMIRMGKTAAEDSDYLKEQAKAAYEAMLLARGGSWILLRGRELSACHRAIRSRVLIRAFSELGLSADLSYAHLENCEAVVFHRGASAVCHLPKGFYLEKIYGDVKAGRRESLTRAQREQNLPRTAVRIFEAEEYRRQKETWPQPFDKDRHCAFDYDAMTRHFGAGFESRMAAGYRQAGDFLPIDENHTKKIQDFFVDQKVPRGDRDSIPLLKIGSEVLWVMPGTYKGRYTSQYKVGKNTKKVICIEIICEI